MTAPVVIAVVSFNTRDLLAECLRSMATEVDAGRAEVWVLDNGSTDGSPEMVERDFPWVTLLLPGTNLGFGPGVNDIARRTESKWIVAANSDVELTPGALETMLNAGRDHPRVGAVSPRLILPDGSVQGSVHSFPGIWSAVVYGLELARVHPTLGRRMTMPGFWDPDESRPVDWATGAFLLIRREAFEEAGGFDDQQWMYAEDIDICWRLRSAGWTTRYEAEATVRHALSAAAADAFGDGMSARIAHATYAWTARTRGLAYAWSLACVNVLAACLRYTAFAAAARVRGGTFASRRDGARRSIGVYRLGLRSRRALLHR